MNLIIDQGEAARLVDLCNQVIMGELWLDIELKKCTPLALELECGIDLTAGPDFTILFQDIFYVSTLMSWRTDTSKPPMRLLVGDEACDINLRYRVEQGYHLFALKPKYSSDDAQCLIIAKTFSWKI